MRANSSKSSRTHTHTHTKHHEMGGPMHTTDQQPRRRTLQPARDGPDVQPARLQFTQNKTSTNFPLHPEERPRETTKHWPRGHRMSRDATSTYNLTDNSLADRACRTVLHAAPCAYNVVNVRSRGPARSGVLAVKRTLQPDRDGYRIIAIARSPFLAP